MRFNAWRFGVKTVIATALVAAGFAYQQLAHPVVSASSAVGQLADTYTSSAQMTAYSWVIPAMWLVIGLVVLAIVISEVRALTAPSKTEKESDQHEAHLER